MLPPQRSSVSNTRRQVASRSLSSMCQPVKSISSFTNQPRQRTARGALSQPPFTTTAAFFVGRRSIHQSMGAMSRQRSLMDSSPYTAPSSPPQVSVIACAPTPTR